MKVLVLGAGVVGVTTAYYLARQGHEVRVVDRQPSVAMETSYGNAGQVSFGFSSPWAAPGIPQKAVKWMFQEHAPLKIQPKMDPTMGRFMMQMLSNCNPERYAINKERMVRVAEHSRACINALRDETGLRYEDRQKGLLQLFRSEKQVEAVGKDMKVLEQCGVRHELLDASRIADVEPALARVPGKFVGGLHLPDDQTGDCHLFTNRLADYCREKLGVEFMFNTTIERLTRVSGKVEAVHTSAGELTADAYVMALGSYSPFLARDLDIRLPIYPVKGYSLTLPVLDDGGAPQSTVMDETFKVAISRFDNRIRVGGTAELASYDLSLAEKRRATISMVVRDVFPEGGDLAKAEFWTGLRPMTPDSTPIIGATKYDNLWLNTGHGTLGWTMSCGSAQLLSDLIDGRAPAIDPNGLAVSRYAA
ncbi:MULTISPECIES: D-amino acid dehydrogenase [Halomonas]|uniref:D-amino acid dehydrogenase n=1 Tax=Halomonas TaxID=2745 RepID=UPI001C97ED30|nr:MULTISPECIES: D-amino acid dehydrogenase [Halomonas]MBY5931063.1 D-amino acid dehydrogenase [Halomonas sp. DP8Y7-3]MBY5968964.1 D-amino acid dehydrogenase [Halomonas denitrificans]MBY6030529.1 D-amino acid dehydrogenase [Halomonas sp. DP8Y7-1]MED5296108.1 D-amino acid dehydrogenase [Pseudomonadota bacterium]